MSKLLFRDEAARKITDLLEGAENSMKKSTLIYEMNNLQSDFHANKLEQLGEYTFCVS